MRSCLLPVRRSSVCRKLDEVHGVVFCRGLSLIFIYQISKFVAGEQGGSEEVLAEPTQQTREHSSLKPVSRESMFFKLFSTH